MGNWFNLRTNLTWKFLRSIRYCRGIFWFVIIGRAFLHASMGILSFASWRLSSAISAHFVKNMHFHYESSLLNVCHWLEEADITCSNMIVTGKVSQIEVAPTYSTHAGWPDAECAFPVLVLPRQLEYDNCIFTWKVLECIILLYYLIEKRKNMRLWYC